MEKESSKARSGFAAFLDNYFYKKESTFFRTRQDEYLIYPNPTNGQFSIAFETTVTEVEIAIVDVLGKLISTHTYSNTSTINLEISQPAGVYYLKCEQNNNTSYEKIVVN